MPTATGTFTVTSFEPTDYTSEITTALAIGHAHLAKQFTGQVTGRSLTQFSFAFDQGAGVGTYVAMEAFEGTLDGRTGTFNFVHGATTTGADRTHEHFVIVPSSGTGELAGIYGSGALAAADGVETMRFDYEFA